MITLSSFDLIIISLFFGVSILIGILGARENQSDKKLYILSGGKIGLILFVMTNVSTWYGGILGIGEYSYKVGVASWFTQGLPYYVFAILFGVFFTGRIKREKFVSIPETIRSVYGENNSRFSALLIFILVSPAPYLLMTGYLFKVLFGIPLITGLSIAFLISAVYLYRGGYRSDVLTDSFFFIIMFAGFFVFLILLYSKYGGYHFLESQLPPGHLDFTGELPFTVIIVWWLVAFWTFADPGFFQRVSSAKSAKVARNGIFISVIFWFIFDFLTNGVGLYSRALLPGLKEPVLSFPALAQQELGSGLKGFFLIALFATILSTLNSFLFLSALTFGNDLFPGRRGDSTVVRIKSGLILSGIFSIILCLLIPSVIEIWYLIGSICIPGIIVIIFSCYFPEYRVSPGFAFIELSGATVISLIWHLLKTQNIFWSILNDIEPMLAGLAFTVMVHLIGMNAKRRGYTAIKEKG